AYSYFRISTAEQADGFGLERQLSYAKAYCERHGLTLDEQTFVDAGVSGFSGANALAGELGAFIELVRSGRVPKGSVLLIENLDRFTRMPADKASALISDVVRAGVEVHTISPEQKYTKANISDLATWLPLQVGFCLSHEESRKKSDRGKDNWARKRAAIAAGKKFGNSIPHWLELQEDRKTWRVIEERAAVVRRIFALTIAGHGQGVIAKELNRSHPHGPRGKGWSAPAVRGILRGRIVLGELTPCTQEKVIDDDKVRRKTTTAGPTVKGYYPALVDEATWYKAQAAIDRRRTTGGRRTGWTNIFGGLLVGTDDGYNLVVRRTGRAKVRQYVSAGALERKPGCKFQGITVEIIEGAILSWLPELKAGDLTGRAVTESNVDEWTAKLSAVNHKIKLTQERAAKADDPTVYLELLDTYGTERKEIAAGLESAKTSAATPAEGALSEAQGIAELLKNAKPDETGELRTRLRAALARLIDKIEVTI
ncbi:unnamed protein product, partial [Phaeothamnion confervicola]